MNLWNSDPVFRNFCSMYREAKDSYNAPHEEGKFHHLTSAIYFSVSCIEAFLNQLKQGELSGSGVDDVKVLKEIRESKFHQKLQNWPKNAAGLNGSVKYSNGVIKFINLFYDIRCGLIHPKSSVTEHYSDLEKLNGLKIIEVTSYFIAESLAFQNEVFPYWLLGWNYVNPRSNTQELVKLNNQQFMFSLSSFGVKIPSSYPEVDIWLANNMVGLVAFKRLRKLLQDFTGCELQIPPINGDCFWSMKPRLCKSWWDTEHVVECGTPSR